MKNNEKYQYQSEYEIKKDIFFEFKKYFLPFFESWKLNKLVFIFQVVNLVLAVIFLNIFLKPILNFITTGIEGERGLAMKMLFTIFSILFLSAFFNNKILKWQTLFKADHNATKKYLKRFLIANIIIYGAKESYTYYEARIKR